jgi:threonine dehydrogenase-like Zn-dependent dehydrogenase
MPALLTPTGPVGIGYSNDNIGGYAERMLLSEALLLEVPNGLASEHAALTEPLAVGIRAVKSQCARRRGAAGDRLWPGGACGDCGTEAQGSRPDHCRRLFAGAAGARRKAWRRNRGRSGADASLCDVGRACHDERLEKAARPAFQAFLPALKPALIFECVGVPGLIQQVFEGAPRDARIVVVGVCMETDRFEPMLGIMKELNVQYVLGYTPEEFARSLRLIADGEVDAASLVTAKVGIDGVAQAFEDLANPEAHTKIIVEPWR